LEHCTSEDIEIRGYKIKKGTKIEGNIWYVAYLLNSSIIPTHCTTHIRAIMREPTTYSNPHTFDPTRFLKPTPDPDPRRYLFGFGRRVCPGQHVANNGAFTMCAAFMSVFDIVAGDETMREVERCGRKEWKMFTPYGAL
jgi:cytochrome P450